jgi:hypothetical protein
MRLRCHASFDHLLRRAHAQRLSTSRGRLEATGLTAKEVGDEGPPSKCPVLPQTHVARVIAFAVAW